MAYQASPAPKMGLGEEENPLARLVRMMAEYYYPGGSPADPRGVNVTDIAMPQQTMPTSDRLVPDAPVRIDLAALQAAQPPQGMPQPQNPGWTTNSVQAVPYQPGMEREGMPMPTPNPERMPIPTRGMMPPGGGAGAPPMPARGDRMSMTEQGGNIPTSATAPREAIIRALMEAEQRPPLPNRTPGAPQFGTLDWWNQMGH